MEKLDYEKLIDPLCIPVIKILGEDLGVETLFCCQGRSKEDPNHSLTGYIACKKEPGVKEILRGISRLLGEKINYPVCYIETTPNFIILRLRKLQKVRKVWERMEEVLKDSYGSKYRGKIF